MQYSTWASVLMILAMTAGCGGGEASTGGGGAGGSGGTGGAGGAPPDNELAFDTDEYSIEPGEEVEYLCFTTRVPEGDKLYIAEVEPIYGKGIHHLGVYQTTKAEPEGTFVCPELTRENWVPIYGGGIESGKLTMPEGAAMVVPGGGQILVQLHLLNTTGESVKDKAHIILRKSEVSDPTRAGIFGFDNRDLTIPALGNDVMQEQTCAPVGRDMDVFAVFGHMHQRGRKIEVSRGATPGEEVLYTADWEFQDQPTVPKSFHVAKDDSIHVRCWYDNPDSYDVHYGEKTADEMCSFVFYYTPFTSLFGCLKSPPQ